VTIPGFPPDPRFPEEAFGKLNKLAAQYLTKQQRINKLRKRLHAKSHEKTWNLACID